jgi:single-strand DNA-binding protein
MRRGCTRSRERAQYIGRYSTGADALHPVDPLDEFARRITITVFADHRFSRLQSESLDFYVARGVRLYTIRSFYRIGARGILYFHFPFCGMYSYNRVHIIGYQTQPVEIRQTPGGTSVTDLNLVVPYAFQSESGERLTGKSFHTVTLWGAMADIAGQYVRPGSQLFIGGRLQTDSWEDEQSKEKRSKTKIVGLDMIMLDPKDGQLPAPEGSALLDGVNRAEIVGNVTRDPEVRTTTSGQQVVTIGVATNDRWKDRSTGEDKERSEFHNVVIWGALAEQVSKQMKKGSRVYVTGRVQTRSWETQSGSKRYTTEVIAEQCTLLGTANPSVADSINASGAPVVRRDTAPSSAQPAPVGAAMPAVQYESEVKVEDLPF